MKSFFKSLKITEATNVFDIETLTIATIVFMIILEYDNLERSPKAQITAVIAVIAWCIQIVCDILRILRGYNKRIILKISSEGLSFHRRGYYYEYNWDDIEFLYEKRRQVFVPMICFKAKNTGIPYEIDLDGIFWTLLPVRWAIKHFGGKSITYYTRHQWSKRQKDPSK